jgi:hypothetical protein
LQHALRKYLHAQVEIFPAGRKIGRAILIFRSFLLSKFRGPLYSVPAGNSGASPQQIAQRMLIAFTQWEGALRSFEQTLANQM